MGIISQYWLKWLCIFKGTYGDTHRVTLTWMAFTKNWPFYFTNFVCCCERKYYLFPAWWWNLEAFITPENMLIRHLCEHDSNILFTSAFKMAELYRFIQIFPHVTNKKSIVFSPLLFSVGRSKINLYLWISSLLWEFSVKCNIGHIAFVYFVSGNQKIHESLSYRVQSL